MPISVQRERGGLVAEELLHHLDVGPFADGQGGAGMPQIVQPNPVDTADYSHRLGEGVPYRQQRTTSMKVAIPTIAAVAELIGTESPDQDNSECPSE